MGIHFIQESYRKLLNSMARPGVIETFGMDLERECMDISFLFGTYTIMKILIDTETTFEAISSGEREDILISQLTGGRSERKADYIFIALDKNREIGEKIREAKKGDLINPEKSATIICEVEDLNKGDLVSIEGPGILDKKVMGLPLLKFWLEERKEKNLEYPMGIDLIFVDTFGKVLSIPRTTKVEEVE